MTKSYLRDKFVIPALVLIGLSWLAVIASAQTNDHLKVYAGFSSVKPEYQDDYIHGVEVGITPTIASAYGISLQATASFATHFKEGGNNSLQLMAGPQVSVSYGRFSPFVRGLFGTTYVYARNVFTKSAGGGLDIKLSEKYFVRPIQYDRQWIEGFYPLTTDRIGAGVGLRF